jgi:hypothetical protein
MTKTAKEIFALRLELVSRGYTPVPLFGKAPPTYRKNRKGLGGWQNLTDVTQEQLVVWATTWPDATNTGILTNFTPAIDIDILNEAAARAAEDLVREKYEERGYVPVRVGRAPKRAILFRTLDPFEKIVVNLKAPSAEPNEKIEFLCDGQQIVTDGIHPDTGLPYGWFGGDPTQIAHDDLAYITADEARALVEDVVELLCRDFNYTRAKGRPGKRRKGNGAAQAAAAEPGAGAEDWAALVGNIQQGRELHDSLLALSAKMIASGMQAGAAVNYLRGLMDAATYPHDERWQERRDEIPGLVDSAVEKYAKASEEPAVPRGTPRPSGLPTDNNADEQRQVLNELNRDNCVVLDGARALVLRFERDKRDIGGESYVYDVPVFLRPADFRMLYLNRKIEVGRTKDGQPILLDIGGWWLGHRDRRQYRGVTFVPAGPQVIDGKINLWRGWGVEPKQGEWGLMRKHIRDVLAAGNKEVDEYIVKWLAWAFQHPAEQAEVAIVFIGDRGTGRGTVGRALCRIFGQHAVHLSSPEQLTGRFNAHLRQCSFLFADEAYGPKDKSAEGQLQRLVTEDTLTIEAKGRDTVEQANRLHVMFASNNDWVIPAGAHERRFVVQRVAETYRQKSAWFKPLYAEMKAGGLAAMLYDLLRIDMGDWHPRQIVETAALAEQQDESLSPLDAWWVDVLHNGELVGSIKYEPDRAVSNNYEEDIEETVRLPFGGTGIRVRRIRREGLFDAARASSPKLRGVTDHAIGRYLKNKGAVRDRVKRRRGWKFPPLARCRDQWCETYPETDWSGDGVSEWQDRAEWHEDTTGKTTSRTRDEADEAWAD